MGEVGVVRNAESDSVAEERMSFPSWLLSTSSQNLKGELDVMFCRRHVLVHVVCYIGGVLMRTCGR